MKQLITIIVVFALGVGVGIGVDRYVLTEKETYTAATIEANIKDISELAVLEMSYTEQENWDGEAKKLLGRDIPFTSKSMQLLYSGVVKAGPNLDNLKVETDGSSISVLLPRSDLISHEIDEDSIKILSIKNGIFNTVTPDNMNEVRKTAKEGKEKMIRESDFLNQADGKAVEKIKQFLQAAYPNAEIKVEVK
ncbi:MAG: DUF4230 domain-containing protein [Mogibacterium sp.]|nr:DUF4230 domain-containing protein [Mogibacterium sp.]